MEYGGMTPLWLPEWGCNYLCNAAPFPHAGS